MYLELEFFPGQRRRRPELQITELRLRACDYTGVFGSCLSLKTGSKPAPRMPVKEKKTQTLDLELGLNASCETL